ncbi:MAG: efflux RND transporter periplasmic adaptor subunit [Planctomycetota bacterium]
MSDVHTDAHPSDHPSDQPSREPSQPGFREELRLGRLLGTAAAVAAIIGLALVAFVALKRSRPKPPSEKPHAAAVGVRVVEAGPRTIAPQVEGLARARPRRRVAIPAEVGGRVVYVAPELGNGARIASGTVVVRIDSADLEAALAQAEAQRAAAQAEVSRLEGQGGYLARRRDLNEAQLELEQAELRRVEGLKGSGINTERELDAARRAVLRTDDQLVSIRQALGQLEPQLLAARARVDELAARCRMAALDLERATIRAPFTGQAANKAVEEHQRVSPGQTLFELWELDELEVPVVLSLADATLLSPDLSPTRLTRVEVIHEQQGEELRWAGRLERFEPLDPETQTVRAVVVVRRAPEVIEAAVPARAEPTLAPGMFCRVLLEGPARAVELAVPVNALQEGSRVYVLRDGRLAHVAVETGRRLGRWVQVRRGLEAGARVIVSPLERAIEGIPLAVLPEPAQQGVSK